MHRKPSDDGAVPYNMLEVELEGMLPVALRLERRVSAVLVGAIAVAAFCFNFVGGNPTVYFLMLVILLALIWSLRWRLPIWRPWDQPSRLMFVGAFFLLAFAFSLSARQWIDLKYIGNFCMFFFFVCLSTVLSRFAAPGNLGRVAVLALCGAVLSLAVAVFEVTALGQPRALGFGSDPIWAAQAAIIIGSLSAIGYLSPTPPIPAPLFLLGPVLADITTWLSGSRGPLLAAPLLALVILIFCGRIARIGFFCLLLAVVAFLVIWHFVDPPSTSRLLSIATNFRSLLSSGEVADGSMDARITLWHIGAAAFTASPIFGYGWSHFLEAAYSHLADHGEAFKAGYEGLSGNVHLHADILDLGVAAGVLGVLAYVLVIAAPIADAWASPRDSQYAGRRMGAAILTVGYAVCGLTYLMFGFEFHTTLYVTVAAILLSLCQDTSPQGQPWQVDPGATKAWRPKAAVKAP
jgi:O-antigen ligase